MNTVKLGYSVPLGDRVDIPVRHMAVVGQTQASGKTTTLQALVDRSNRRAIAFLTKRGEGGFEDVPIIPPCFRERADWQFVSAVLEATMRERMKFERAWIMRACKGARTLSEVHANVRKLMESSKGLSGDMYMQLDAYLQIVIPQVDKLPYVDEVRSQPGLSVMDLSGYTTELQALVIRSVLEWVYEREKGMIVVIPEAWEFLPLARSSPVLLAAEQLIRKGGALENFLWLDSQDIAGVHVNIRRSIGVWLLGVQREVNEIDRALAHIPKTLRPTAEDIMHLERGQFIACFDKTVVKTYVEPIWLSRAKLTDSPNSIAQGIAMGLHPLVPKPARSDTVNQVEAAELRQTVKALQKQIDNQGDIITSLKAQIKDLETRLAAERASGTIAYQMATGVMPSQIPDLPASAAAQGLREKAADVLQHLEDRALDQVAERVAERLRSDPARFQLTINRPEMHVAVKRQTVNADSGTWLGMIALLISEGFFNEPRTSSEAHKEGARRGLAGIPARAYEQLEKLNALGFVTNEGKGVGYKVVPDMIVHIREEATV